MELQRIAATMRLEDFERQLGPFVLVQRPPDELTQKRALALGARRTVAVKKDAPRDDLGLLFEFDDLLVATLPPAVASESLTVGRLPDCDVVVDDPSVSKHHARLSWNEALWAVEDLGSANGTRLNGRLVEGMGLIQDGDELAFGDARYLMLRTATLHQRLTTGRFRAQ
ncbi:MAG: FHA domain-containing protein [Myxococcota bacterium]